MSELGSEEKTRLMIGIFAKVEICYFGSKSLVVGKEMLSKSLVVGNEMVGGWLAQSLW
jgi:hypothetical protein